MKDEATEPRKSNSICHRMSRYIYENHPLEDGDELSAMEWILYGGTAILMIGVYFKLEPYLGRDNTLIVSGLLLIVLYWIYIRLYKER
jgi:hypothetical protein